MRYGCDKVHVVLFIVLLSAFHPSKQVSVCTAGATTKYNSPMFSPRQDLCTKILPLQVVYKLPDSFCDFFQQSDVQHAADRSGWPREGVSFWLLLRRRVQLKDLYSLKYRNSHRSPFP